MAVEIRTCEPDELHLAFAPISHYFGRVPTPEDGERWARILPPERMHAAWEAGAVVGGAGAYAFDLTVPGGTVPAGGVLAVGVLPTHRRRGILSELMRTQLATFRERGEPVALLYASEGAIYTRYGYGVASFQGELELAREHATLVAGSPPRGTFRLVETEEALSLFAAVYDRVRPGRPGMFARTPDWWEVRRFARLSMARDVPEPVRVVYEVDGEPEGYALYTVGFGIEYSASTSRLEVREALGATPEATRAVWAYLLGLDWMATIQAGMLPVDHPLFLLLAEPRRMRFTLGEALWVRLVDVESALSARSYRNAEPVVIEVTDELCPWNAGRWRVGGSGAQRTDDAPDLRLDVRELGSTYLGGVTFERLAAAGRLDEHAPAGVACADALFRTDRAPWCPEIF